MRCRKRRLLGGRLTRSLLSLEDASYRLTSSLDLYNFKPFNDIFGFCKGDEAILLVAELLQGNTDPSNTFIGHIGGDDFELIFWDQARLDTVHSILRRVASFYRSKPVSPILAKDRQGRLCSYSRMNLSVGAMIRDGQQQQLHDLDLSEEAAIAKHHAKNQRGSSLISVDISPAYLLARKDRTISTCINIQ